MNKNHNPHIRPGLTGLAIGLAATLLASYTSLAVPYASQVVKTGDNVNFVLNQDCQGITVLRDGSPAAGITTNAGLKSFTMANFTSYQIIVTGNTAKAWKEYVADGLDRKFYSPRGVAINKNPKSPNFGKVYISEARGGTTGGTYARATTDGIYVLRADGAADGGPFTGGANWTTDGTGATAPTRSVIGPDDHLYVVNQNRSNAFEFSADMAVATQLTYPSNLTAGQQVHGIYVEGNRATGDRMLYLVNGRYTDARRGLIRYNLGANAGASDQGEQILGPDYFNYYGYDVARDSLGFWYVNQYRAKAGEAYPLAKFDGSYYPNNTPVWTVPNSSFYAYSIDLYEPSKLVAYGRDYDGFVYFFNSDTGTAVTNFDAGSTLRELAFDVVGNLVTVDNTLERARFWSPGGVTVATTGSDQTFQLLMPDNIEITSATDPVAAEEGTDTATFTISRYAGANGNLQVYFTLGGTAAAGDYSASVTSPFTFQAGMTSTNITITPVNDSQREPAETVVLTITPNGNYYLAQPEATVTILDNDMVLSYWDPNGPDAGAGSILTGTWGTDNFWTSSPDGTVATGPWTDWLAPVFSAGVDAAGYAYTVTVSGTQKADYLNFEDGWVTLEGGTLTLTNFSGIQVPSGYSATINSALNGTSLMLDGPGSLVLGGSAANTYAGPTVINGGILQLGAADRIPDGSAVQIGNGKVDLGSFSETVGSLAGSTGAVVNVMSGLALTFGGDNSDTLWDGSTTGGGLLTKTGTGTMVIGSGTINEPFAISNGVVAIDSLTDLGGSANAADLIVDGGTLRGLGGNLLIPYFRSLIVGPSGGVINVEGASDIWLFGNVGSKFISGGTLIKDGPGEFRPQGMPVTSSTFEKLVIRNGLYRGGYLDLKQGEQFLGAIPATFIPDQITISNRARLDHSLFMFEVSANRGVVLGPGGGIIGGIGSWVFPGIISGSQLIKNGVSYLVLAGANTYTGGTIVDGGSLIARNTTGSATGSGTLNVTNSTVAGDGIIGGPVLMSGGLLTPGYNYSLTNFVTGGPSTIVSNSIAKLVLTNGLDMSLGATNSWELGALSTAAADCDQVELRGGNLVLGGSSRLAIGFVGTATAPSATEPFWQQGHEWKLISLTGSATNVGNTTFSAISGTNGVGAFSTISDPTGVTLVYTPPIPASAVTNMAITVSGGNVTITYSGGAGTAFVLTRALNVEAPLASWARIATNTTGSGTFTIPVGTDPKAFYRIKSE